MGLGNDDSPAPVPLHYADTMTDLQAGSWIKAESAKQGGGGKLLGSRCHRVGPGVPGVTYTTLPEHAGGERRRRRVGGRRAGDLGVGGGEPASIWPLVWLGRRLGHPLAWAVHAGESFAHRLEDLVDPSRHEGGHLPAATE